ncbi:hypothetical protein M1N56_07965 [Dehalococcoidia bacterium]|nr:hypothetical protein [Dehalococcoidia bacterium]
MTISCETCGRELISAYKFCPGCGNSVDSDAVEEHEKQIEVEFRDPVLKSILAFYVDEALDRFTEADLKNAKKVSDELKNDPNYEYGNLSWSEDWPDEPLSSTGLMTSVMSKFIERYRKHVKITKGELELFTELHLQRFEDDPEIYDLTGMEHLTKLQKLSLADYHGSFRSIEPLGELTELRNLDIFGNNLNDINPLANLTKLTRLSISRENIGDGDLTPLVNLSSLRVLDLDEGFWLQDMTFLSDLESLEFIFVSPATLMDEDAPRLIAEFKSHGVEVYDYYTLWNRNPGAQSEFDF